MTLDKNILSVVGSFANIGGSARANVAALLSTKRTSNATTWNPGVVTTVYSLYGIVNNIFIGADFTTLNGSASRIRFGTILYST